MWKKYRTKLGGFEFEIDPENLKVRIGGKVLDVDYVYWIPEKWTYGIKLTKGGMILTTNDNELLSALDKSIKRRIEEMMRW